MYPWRFIVFVALLAGFTGNSTTSAQVKKKAAGDDKLVSKKLAEPVILAYIQKELNGGPTAKIESLSDPMEPDKKTADLHRAFGGATAFYVTYSKFSEVTDSRIKYPQIMWVGMKDGKAFVQGYQNIDVFEQKADKAWLKKYPIPK